MSYLKSESPVLGVAQGDLLTVVHPFFPAEEVARQGLRTAETVLEHRMQSGNCILFTSALVVYWCIATVLIHMISSEF